MHVIIPSLQLGPRHGRMVLKLREKGWIVILRQVIPTSPLSLYGMERFRVRNFPWLINAGKFWCRELMAIDIVK
jgi:hypothetical protein